jgi:ACS family tartrate transporter-like MFS transporter
MPPITAKARYGGVSIACAQLVLSDRSQLSFYSVRTLLGAAEAGFFPGIIYYLSTWFPATHRARVTGLFMACIPLSSAIGSPISTALLYLDGALGLRGWQWMFLVEGVPPILLGFVTWFYLTERPADAKWLEADERAWLSQTIENESIRKRQQLSLSVLQTFFNPRVLALGVVCFGLASLLFGVGFFLPTIVKGFGLTNMQTGWVSIIPPATGAAAMIWWGRHSDRTMERKGHLLISMTFAALGVVGAAFVDDPVLKMVAFTVSAVGLNASNSVFWTLAPSFLTGASAAVGIAYINSFAALGAFLAPWMMGMVKDATGSFSYGLLALGGFVVVGACVILGFTHDGALEREPARRMA